MATIPTGEVFEALAVWAETVEDMTVGIGRRGGITGLEDVDQQAR